MSSNQIQVQTRCNNKFKPEQVQAEDNNTFKAGTKMSSNQIQEEVQARENKLNAEKQQVRTRCKNKFKPETTTS